MRTDNAEHTTNSRHRRVGDRIDVEQVFAGSGEMGALIRTTDWSKTAIGPIESWSPSLRMMVRLLLANRFPLLLWWGPEYISIYNDAYRPILGTKHPWALGKPVSDCWSEIWHVLQPLIDTPFKGGPSTWNDDILLELNRHGFLEETHFTIAYSPVPDETVPSGIGGVLATVHEITEKVVAERRVVALRDLGAHVGDAKTAQDACVVAARTLGAHAKDVPFALLYLLDADARRAHLAGAAGVGIDEAISPRTVDLGRARSDGWPFREALQSHALQVVPRLHDHFNSVPAGPWSDPPTMGVVVTIPSNKPREPVGFMVVGVSARLEFDEYYRDFVELVRSQVATAIANARAYEEERKRAEALAQIDRTKTAFFSNVSHEFRTPLTLMLGPCEDLLAGAHGDVTDAQRSQIEVVHRNSLRLQKLVNALLDFSRIEAGRAQACYESLDLAALTADVASAFRSAIERAGLRFNVDCAALSGPVFVDRDMWEKIVLNLLSNALKFTFEGCIEVSLRNASNSVELRVVDTGVGVPPSEIPRLFERFHRVEGTRSRTHEGSGIGLALVQELVKLHGGSIRAESQLGRGTSFVITIPKGDAHLPKDRISAARATTSSTLGAAPFVQEALRWLPARPSESPGLSRVGGEESAEADVPYENLGRVLLVDDNADMRDYARRILEPYWVVEAVADGIEAFRIACTNPPDLIVTDIMMPGLDGFGLLRSLRGREETKLIPVIMLSARAGEEARVDGLQAGAEDYLVKPFSARELLARVRMHIEAAQLRKMAEAERNRLRGLLGQLPAIVNFLRGPELVLEFAHPKAVEHLGGRDVIGKPLLEAIPEFRDQEFPILLRRVLDTGQRVEGREKLVRLSDGKGGLYESYWDFIYLPVHNDRGHVEGVMTFDVEVTDRVRDRQAIDASRARLLAEMERAVRFSETFIGILGHDLRNPLGAIAAAAELLSRRADAPERFSAPVRRILRSAGRMERMISQLLDFTRIRLGCGVPLEHEDTDLTEVARAVIDEVESACERNMRIEISGNATGTWDRDRLSQLLSNLAANACQHSPPGSTVEIRIDGTCADKVTFDIRNAGVIPDDLLTTIFEPLRDAADRRSGSGGLGLGLYITQQIVLAHGGTIRADSDPSQGTRFTVELPRHPPTHVSHVFGRSLVAPEMRAGTSEQVANTT